MLRGNPFILALLMQTGIFLHKFIYYIFRNTSNLTKRGMIFLSLSLNVGTVGFLSLKDAAQRPRSKVSAEQTVGVCSLQRAHNGFKLLLKIRCPGPFRRKRKSKMFPNKHPTSTCCLCTPTFFHNSLTIRLAVAHIL